MVDRTAVLHVAADAENCELKGCLKVNSANQGMVGYGMSEPNTLLLN